MNGDDLKPIPFLLIEGDPSDALYQERALQERCLDDSKVRQTAEDSILSLADVLRNVLRVC